MNDEVSLHSSDVSTPPEASDGLGSSLPLSREEDVGGQILSCSSGLATSVFQPPSFIQKPVLVSDLSAAPFVSANKASSFMGIKNVHYLSKFTGFLSVLLRGF